MKVLNFTFLFILVSFFAQAQLTSGRAVVQGENMTSAATSYSRAVFSHNAYWDASQSRWVINPIGANDAQAILIPNQGGFDFIVHKSTGNSTRKLTHNAFTGGRVMTISKEGEVGIGTGVTSGYKLSVNGNVRAKDIRVYTSWADFVFANDYQLRPLNEVEKFIEKNGHLPEIPSAKEVAKNGVQLGEMNVKLLQKVEELTLYIIQQNKKIEALEQKIKAKK
ncbi:hypothetical protein BKI52_22205 [marine bacterium AO1-C]|nr:hypothetical protein BKI52_22205 [marine bacterium AO1-C]